MLGCAGEAAAAAYEVTVVVCTGCVCVNVVEMVLVCAGRVWNCVSTVVCVYERDVVSVSICVVVIEVSAMVVVVVTAGKVFVVLTVAVRVEVTVTGFTKGGKLQPTL